jgi:RHS repeat-associated protein
MIRDTDDVDGNSQDDNATRHYDPTTGRWLNVEPVGHEAGDTNLYRYVGNAPLNSTDPFTASADPKT